ncbi:hypothetical protein HAX54_038019, partial [Datura stramonium]|nr:hypothetical protein [Datura stramonium]
VGTSVEHGKQSEKKKKKESMGNAYKTDVFTKTVRVWLHRLRFSSPSWVRPLIDTLSSRKTVHPLTRRLRISSRWFPETLALVG